MPLAVGDSNQPPNSLEPPESSIYLVHLPLSPSPRVIVKPGEGNQPIGFARSEFVFRVPTALANWLCSFKYFYGNH
jgi:hypothetical protein